MQKIEEKKLKEDWFCENYFVPFPYPCGDNAKWNKITQRKTQNQFWYINKA